MKNPLRLTFLISPGNRVSHYNFQPTADYRVLLQVQINSKWGDSTRIVGSAQTESSALCMSSERLCNLPLPLNSLLEKVYDFVSIQNSLPRLKKRLYIAR